jgi:sugar transferase (PEP-CTERM system associated)
MILKNRARKLCLMIFEGGLIYLCGVAATYLRFSGEAFEVFTAQRGWLKILLLTVIAQGAFYLFDLYDFRMIRQHVTLYTRIFQALGLGAFTLALIFYVLPDVTIGRGVFLLSLVLMLTMMVGWRLLVMWLIGHPRLTDRVLILGTGEQAVKLAREVLERRESGYSVVGFVGTDPKLIGQSLINPKVVGVINDLEEVTHGHQVNQIVVAFDDQQSQLPTSSLLRLKFGAEVSIEDSASFYEKLTRKVSVDMLQPSGLIFSANSWWRPFYKRVRKLADIVLGVIGLVLASPLMAVAMIAVKLDSRGPVFYTQERVGLNNRPFKIIKFRSMHVNAEQDGPVWAGQGDPRVTRVGHVIRKLRIDELPQFLNVLRGEMSIIGPRPEREVFVELFEREIPYYSQRHLVKPGITGWAQVRYPYGASLEDAIEKLQYDLYYIKNQSPLLDIIILFETVRIVLFGRFAR